MTRPGTRTGPDDVPGLGSEGSRPGDGVRLASLGLSRTAIRPGYHLSKRHWNTVTLDGSLPDTLIRDLVEDSYDVVVSALPKRTRKQLGWAPEAGASRG